MKITSVSFRANTQIDGFQHVHIEATASVFEGETPEGVLEVLKTFVARELVRAKKGYSDIIPQRAKSFKKLLAEANEFEHD